MAAAPMGRAAAGAALKAPAVLRARSGAPPSTSTAVRTSRRPAVPDRVELAARAAPESRGWAARVAMAGTAVTLAALQTGKITTVVPEELVGLAAMPSVLAAGQAGVRER